jgi:hypothetical protein
MSFPSRIDRHTLILLISAITAILAVRLGSLPLAKDLADGPPEVGFLSHRERACRSSRLAMAHHGYRFLQFPRWG